MTDGVELRDEIRTWLAEHLVGEFRQLVGRGGPADEEMWELNVAWERELAAGGWVGLGWPSEHGGRGASTVEQVIFHEEYALARAPGRVAYLGETMLGPTLIEFGTSEQQQRFLPGILAATDLWCQGYSEPDAGSDLANIRTRAVLDGDEWVVDGQKVWTSLAQHATYCFALCRTDPAASRHRGISYVIIPMDQPGVVVRPIRQMTGTSEFNEVYFEGARTPREWIVGAVGDGWRVGMGTLGYERSRRLAVFPSMDAELRRVIAQAQRRGRANEPVVRQRLARSYTELMVLRATNLRMLSDLASGSTPGPSASIGKLFWSGWHQRLCELEMDVLGLDGQVVPGESYHLTASQHAFLYSRAETIFAGSSEVQRNIIGERVLGLPKQEVPVDGSGR